VSLRAPDSPLGHAAELDGARWTEWNGRIWAADFGDPLAEHRAVRDGVGLWDISALHTWQVRSPDAALVVEQAFSNQVTGLKPGAVRYGLLCDRDGLVINDATVYVLSPEEVWVITSRETDGDHLARWMPARAIGSQRALLALQGPGSRRLLSGLGVEVSALDYFRFFPYEVAVSGVPCWLSRVGYSGELGFELFCSRDEADLVWRGLRERGAQPYGLAAVHTLRIEAGLLMLGEDFHPGRTRAVDLSLDAVMRADGTFLGAAAIRHQRDGPRRAVATLEVIGTVVPAPGDTVASWKRPVGSVTSACASPTLGRVIALASLEDPLALGTSVSIDREGSTLAATIGTTPVYDPGKHRRRG
jgi:aminomethyltransferase